MPQRTCLRLIGEGVGREGRYRAARSPNRPGDDVLVPDADAPPGLHVRLPDLDQSLGAARADPVRTDRADGRRGSHRRAHPLRGARGVGNPELLLAAAGRDNSLTVREASTSRGRLDAQRELDRAVWRRDALEHGAVHDSP